MEALSAQDEPRFWQTVIVFIAVLVIYALLPAGYTYLRDRFLGRQSSNPPTRSDRSD